MCAGRAARHRQIHAGEAAGDDSAAAHAGRGAGDDEDSQHRRPAETRAGAGDAAAVPLAPPHGERCRAARRQRQSHAR